MRTSPRSSRSAAPSATPRTRRSPVSPRRPLGVLLDTPEHVRANAARIDAQAVATHAMPLGNVTHMTDAERATLGAWIARAERQI